MKYLSDYMNDKQSALFKSTGAFFAFSQKQFDEAKVKDVVYNTLGTGMICPKERVDELLAGLETIYDDAVKLDIAENGVKAIIHRELGNHECQITNDTSNVVDNLEPYGITEEQITAEWPEFYQKCVKNDWF